MSAAGALGTWRESTRMRRSFLLLSLAISPSLAGGSPLLGDGRRGNCGAGTPKAGCECSTHSVGAISPLKHIEMCSALVMRRKLVQIQPSAPYEPFKL